eukprot:GHVP01068809.1.p1 GENE.GHVP01068809.1~~GHVP01068809.1.p1  ORF type:complete len:144 (-),score=36.19 GHVP01068809.1:82-468(-)
MHEENQTEIVADEIIDDAPEILKLGDEERRKRREARFGVVSTKGQSSVKSVKPGKGIEISVGDSKENEKRKTRAMRFGPSVPTSMDEATRRKIRAARFLKTTEAEISAGGDSVEWKKRLLQRKMRFQN